MKSHYETLEVEKNCSAEDIKTSYIKLSKKYHPDKNKNSDAHKKFVQVNEAYSVLGKKESRIKYDESLLTIRRRAQGFDRMSTQNINNYYDYLHRNKMRENYENGGYFNKSKFSTLLFCGFLMLFGAGIHLKRDKEQRNLKNQAASIVLAHVNRRAHQVGREQTIKDFANGTFRGVSQKEAFDKLREQNK